MEQRFVFIAGGGDSACRETRTALGANPKIFAIDFETRAFQLNPPEAAAAMLQDIAERESAGAPIVLEATPMNLYEAAKILNVFPTAKLVLLYRDGRDAIVPAERGADSLDDAISRWKADIEETLRWKYDPRVRIQRYEDLIQEPSRVLNALCEFIGITAGPEMLALHEGGRIEDSPSREGKPEPQHPARRRVPSRISESKARRKTLTASDLARFNAVCAEMMEELGYYDPLIGETEPPFSQVSILEGVAKLEPYDDWFCQMTGKKSEFAESSFSLNDMIEEKHHRSYGRPWCLGRDYFEFFISKGLRRSDIFLDFGCGAGRVGVPIMRYLKPGRYYGVEAHRLSLEAFARYEIPASGLSYKSPRLMHDEECSLHLFGKKFDVIADLFVTHHLPNKKVGMIYRKFVEFLAKDGRIFVPHAPKLTAKMLEEIGLVLLETQHRTNRLLKLIGADNIQRTDHWHILGHA